MFLENDHFKYQFAEMVKLLRLIAKLCMLCRMLIGVVFSLNVTALITVCQLSVFCVNCIQLCGTVPVQLSVYCYVAQCLFSCLYTVWTVYSYVPQCQFSCRCQLPVYCVNCVQLSGTVPVQLSLSAACILCELSTDKWHSASSAVTVSCLYTV
jgi:hypothetical protein